MPKSKQKMYKKLIGDLWQVPNNCYTRMRVSYAELQEKVRPCEEIGRYLFNEMQDYGNSEKANWTMGERLRNMRLHCRSAHMKKHDEQIENVTKKAVQKAKDKGAK